MSDEITDEALDAAAETVAVDDVPTDDVEEEVVEDAVEEVKAISDPVETVDEVVDTPAGDDDLPPEPDDHGERSALGRRVGEIDRTVNARMDQMMERMDSFLQGVQTMQTPQQPAAPAYDPNEEIPMNMGELNTLLDARDQRRQQEHEQDTTRYESGYREQFTELVKGLDPEEGKKVEDEMLANFNVRHSNDPTLDAERNFLRAENVVLRNRPPEKPKVNLRESTPKGGASATTTATKTAATVTLDADAAGLVADMKAKHGWTDEDTKNALEGEMPLNLVQGNLSVR